MSMDTHHPHERTMNTSVRPGTINPPTLRRQNIPPPLSIPRDNRHLHQLFYRDCGHQSSTYAFCEIIYDRTCRNPGEIFMKDGACRACVAQGFGKDQSGGKFGSSGGSGIFGGLRKKLGFGGSGADKGKRKKKKEDSGGGGAAAEAGENQTENPDGQAEAEDDPNVRPRRSNFSGFRGRSGVEREVQEDPAEDEEENPEDPLLMFNDATYLDHLFGPLSDEEEEQEDRVRAEGVQEQAIEAIEVQEQPVERTEVQDQPVEIEEEERPEVEADAAQTQPGKKRSVKKFVRNLFKPKEKKAALERSENVEDSGEQERAEAVEENSDSSSSTTVVDTPEPPEATGHWWTTVGEWGHIDGTPIRRPETRGRG